MNLLFMECAIIVAIGENGEIGKDNRLLWHLPRDMKFFKETTVHNTVVMGRKSWESIPEKYRPLPHRNNIVITRNKNYKANGAVVIHNLDELNNIVPKEHTCFIIGGAEIYNLALQADIINALYVTHVHHHFKADAFFPSINWEEWRSSTLLDQVNDAKNPYSFTIKKYTK